MFNFFGKSKVDTVELEDLKPKATPKPKAPPKPTHEFYHYTSYSGVSYECVLLTDVETVKRGTIHILIPINSSDNPYVKMNPKIHWVHESYCTPIASRSVEHIPKGMLDASKWDIVNLTYRGF